MLKNKVVFVSGGTGFLGREICKICHANGAEKIIFSYNNGKEKADLLQKEIPNSEAIKINFRDINNITQEIEQLYQRVPKIDVLVNNAAVSQAMPFALLEEEDVDLALDINIKGTLFLTKAVVRGMIRQKSGSVVNIGSIAGNRILQVPITYAISKSAITGFTVSLAAELKKFNIRVNTVVPGMLEGGVVKGVPDELKQEFLKHCLAGRQGSAAEVANLVCFLASEKASYINGQHISIDGGI